AQNHGGKLNERGGPCAENDMQFAGSCLSDGRSRQASLIEANRALLHFPHIILLGGIDLLDRLRRRAVWMNDRRGSRLRMCRRSESRGKSHESREKDRKSLH